MGLLSRASTLDTPVTNQGLAFSDFINKHSIKLCALLEQKNSYYCVSNSIGFDCESIICADSTVDFWNGICSNSNKIYTFTGTDKNPLLQLFSINLKEKLQELSVYKNISNQILLCEGILSDKAAQDFNKISNSEHTNEYNNINPLLKENTVVLLYKIDIEKAVKAFYNSQSTNTKHNFESFNKAIINEVYNRFACLYNNSDTTIKDSDHSIKTVIITDKAYSVELITQHIKLNLQEVFDSYASEVQISFSGKATSCDAIKDYLQAE